MGILLFLVACNRSALVEKESVLPLSAQEISISTETKNNSELNDDKSNINDSVKWTEKKMVTISYIDLGFDDENRVIVDTFYRQHTLGLHVLVESTMLPQTRNQLNARGVGLWNGKLHVEECVNTRTDGKRDKFLEISENDTTLNIKWQVIDNCCFSFLGDFEVANDSTLNCIYQSYGTTHCACNCEYKVTYQLNKQTGYEENYEKIKYISLNGQLLKNIERYKNK